MFRILVIITLLMPGIRVFAQNDSVPASRETIIDSSILITGSTREQGKVQVRWSVNPESNPEYFSIERSCNDRPFEVVGLIKFLPGKPWIEWVDEAPSPGKNLYRVKLVNDQPVVYYSPTVTAMMAGEITFRFYPNPVDNILILRSSAPLEIQVIDANGQVRLPVIKLNGLQTVNVSGLDKGVYFLRIQNKMTNVVSQERMVKN